MRLALDVTWYRFKATFKRRWTGYLSVTVLIALVGGVSLAALAGARRTESSFPTYLASTDPSTVELFTSYLAPNLGDNSGYRAGLNAEIAHLRLVSRAVTSVIFDGNIDLSRVKGVHHDALPGEAPPAITGSSDGEFTEVDRVSLVAGRMFDQGSTDEAVMNVQAAQELGVHIGSVLTAPFYTDAELLSNSNSLKPTLVTIRLVGEVIASRW